MGGSVPGFKFTGYATSDDPEKLGALGDTVFSEGKKYVLVQAHTVCLSDVIPANAVLYRTATANVVTNDTSEGVSNSVNNYCGVAPALDASVPESTSAIKYYFWMQTEGDATVTTNGDDDISAGDLIIAAADGVCNSAASSTVFVDIIGTATADDVNGSDTVVVKLRPV
jgi:hypothetical protein